MTSLIRLILGHNDHPATVENLGVTPHPTPNVTLPPEELDRQILTLFEGGGSSRRPGNGSVPAQSA